MKRTFFLGLAILMAMSVSLAQEVEPDQKHSCAQYWQQNWFVEISVGGEMLFSPNADVRPFGRRISPALGITAGKWFTPFVGARLKVDGFQMFGARNAYGIYLNDPIEGNTLFGNDDPVRDHVTIFPNGNYYTRSYYQNSHLDLMVSVLNLVYGGYSSDQPWDVIPTVGMGYMTVFKNQGTPLAHLFTSNFGVQGKYRFNENWDLNLSVDYALFSDLFDSRFTGAKYAGNLRLSAGVTYNIFGHSFKKANYYQDNDVKPIERYVTKEVVREVTQMVYDTIQVYDTLSSSKEFTKVIRDTVRIKDVKNVDFVNSALGYVLFDLGAVRPSSSVELQCVNVSQFLQEHPDATITLYGYADKMTGTDEVNLEISKQRIAYLKNLLVKKYHVAPERVHEQPLGSSAQVYGQSDLNRLVVIKVDQ